jgi:excisionase family DNA binding protein
LDSLLHQSCTNILKQIKTGLQQYSNIKSKDMTTAITLLTEDQAREIAEQAAIRAVELLIKNFEPKPEENPSSEIMTLKETAEYLKCSTITVYRKVKKNGLPIYRKLGHPRFIRFEVEKWLRGKL